MTTNEENNSSSALSRVLVIEDDLGTRESIAMSFEISYPGVVVSQHDRSSGVVEDILQTKPDLLTLDLGLPDGDGLTLIRSIRAVSQVPIIVISARDDDSSLVAAIRLGADEFLVKPVSLVGLQAHIEAIIRLKNRNDSEFAISQIIKLSGSTIDLDHGTVEIDGLSQSLSKTDLYFLIILNRSNGRIVPLDDIKVAVWGNNEVADSAVKMAVHRLRQRIGDADQKRPAIVNHRGIGYSLSLQ
ncbi:response regulator transcription factor [Dehalococcoides mccartyi]|nr:response regulator transcription factor [Dehalococcoides mccartyi]